MLCSLALGQTEPRTRARDLGIKVGVLPPGPLNAITDVAGVKVGHTTLIQGENVRTGVTALQTADGSIMIVPPKKPSTIRSSARMTSPAAGTP